MSYFVAVPGIILPAPTLHSKEQLWFAVSKWCAKLKHTVAAITIWLSLSSLVVMISSTYYLAFCGSTAGTKVWEQKVTVDSCRK